MSDLDSQSSDNSWEMDIDDEDESQEPMKNFQRQTNYEVFHFSSIESRIEKMIQEFAELSGLS